MRDYDPSVRLKATAPFESNFEGKEIEGEGRNCKE